MVSPRSSPAQSIITENVVAFLRTVPPFQFLCDADLRIAATAMSLEYFPRDAVILSAGERASESLYIVQKGGVKLTIDTDQGAEVVLDMRSEGELFGLLSVMGGDVTRLDVTAVEDTLCYTLAGEHVQRLMAAHPDFAGYMVRTSVSRYVDRSLAEIRERAHLLNDGERLLYSLSVADVAKQRVTACGEQTPIQRAAQLMAADRSTCIVVQDTSGHAVGIVSDKDFTAKVVAAGLPADTPVCEIMSSPVASIEASEHIFMAMLEMLSRNIHHLLVTREAVPASVLTYHDLLLLQGKSPLTLMRHIGRQNTLEELIAAQGRTSELIPLLMREGARASHIVRIVAEMNDRVVAKIMELVERELGPPPVPYAWVAFGSEGRREQTFKTDQDNGIVYSDEGAGEPEVEEYFERFATQARNALEACGYPPCKGDYMASNIRWRQPLSVWKQYFHTWIRDPEQNAACDALICFDMRPVAGDPKIFAELAHHNRELLAQAEFFKSVFAFVSLTHRPPLGFFRNLIVERGGEHKHEFDVKLHGTGPIVNAVRMFALDALAEATNTFDRITALRDLTYADDKLLRDLDEALEFLTLLRLQRQAEQARDGQPVGNYINPASLSHLQRGLLKEAFAAITRAQSLVQSKFESWVWQHMR
jgi:CBS domain-containing protein